MANDALRPLPLGAALDGARFTWTPAPGHVGPNHLVFLRGAERIDVHVTVAPPVPAREGEAQVRMHLDSVTQTPIHSTVHPQIRLQGWALDPHAAIGSGIEAVHVWARRIDSLLPATPVFVGEAALDVARPDVARAFGSSFGHAGFEFTGELESGTWQVTVYVWNRRTGRFEDARSATITVR